MKIRRKEITISEAALTYGIARRTIYNKIQGKHNQNCGRPTVFCAAEEQSFVQHLLLLAEFDMPVVYVDVKVCIRNYLEERGQCIPIFKNNLPGKDWLYGFLRRHPVLSSRLATNIKIVRAAVSEDVIRAYVGNLSKTIAGIPPTNIYNFDETNLTDDPGRKKVICKRGIDP